MRSNKYMAKSPKPQEVFTKIHFFVNYVKMLCKHLYVNHINRRFPALCKNDGSPISGETVKTMHHILDKKRRRPARTLSAVSVDKKMSEILFSLF